MPKHQLSQYKAIQMMLQQMGVPQHGVLFVHSAFKVLAQEGYTVAVVLQALVDYMQAGTLLLPTMSWRYVTVDKPYFYKKDTPSHTGILTEQFRQHYATYRSLHPTHSVAGIGRLAETFLEKHHLSITPCDENSPFAALVTHDAYILMLGIGMDCCTLIHHAEEMLAPDYYVRPASTLETYQCINDQGQCSTVKLRRHLFLARNYWQFQDRLAEEGALNIYRCGNAICCGFTAKKAFQIVADVLECRPDAIIARPGQRYRMM